MTSIRGRRVAKTAAVCSIGKSRRLICKSRQMLARLGRPHGYIWTMSLCHHNGESGTGHSASMVTGKTINATSTLHPTVSSFSAGVVAHFRNEGRDKLSA